MHPLLKLLAVKATPLARWGLVWWPALCAALYVKREMIGGDSLAFIARMAGKNEGAQQGDVDWLARFTFLERLSFFRGELLWGLLILPGFSLLLTSGRRASRWRGPILAATSILLSCLLFAEYRTLRSFGRMLSMTLTSDALAFANCCMPVRGGYFRWRGVAELTVLVLLTLGLAWWAGRQNRKEEKSDAPRSLVHAAVPLGLWGLAWVIALAAWLPWLPPVRFHTSVLETALKTFVFEDKLDTSAYVGLTLEELSQRYRELTHSPDPRPSRYWGAAKDCDVLIFALETASARSLPIEGDLFDCPNLARLRERSFAASRHYSTYPYSNRAIFSILSSWYPSTLMQSFPQRHPTLLYPGMMQSLKRLGYQTAVYVPDAYTYQKDDLMYQNLGIERRVYIEMQQGQGKYTVPSSTETNAQRRLRLDRDCLRALKADMHAWQQSGERFAALFTPQIGHSPWAELTQDGKDPKDAIAFGRKLIAMQDAWLGEILDQLAACGRLEKTLIVVVGDHGTRNKWEAADFRPGMLENQAFHVPLLIYAPAALTQRIDVRHITSHIDIGPSLLDLLGVQEGRDSEQGSSIWDERIQNRNVYFGANHLMGTDGFYCGEGRYCMWNHFNEIVYENPYFDFDTSCLVSKDSPRYREIVQHMKSVFALQEVWASSRCCTINNSPSANGAVSARR